MTVENKIVERLKQFTSKTELAQEIVRLEQENAKEYEEWSQQFKVYGTEIERLSNKNNRLEQQLATAQRAADCMAALERLVEGGREFVIDNYGIKEHGEYLEGPDLRSAIEAAVTKGGE